jgi:hypothetical protein
MKKLFLLLCIATATGISSCNKELITGSGTIGSKTMNLQPFTAVESHYDIKAVIIYGNVQEVTATGYDNLLNILDFKVENGILKLKFNTTYNTIRNSNIVAYIKLPILSSVAIHGSQNIEVNGFSNGNTINAKIHGSGHIRINGSEYQSALLEVHGSGDIDAQGLRAKLAEAKIHGSGNASVFVIDRLKAGIFGSGSVYFWGNPTVETTVNGSGRVIRR